MQLNNGLYFEGQADGGGATGDDPGKKVEGANTKTFTQEQLDAAFGERAKQAASKATTDLLATLGVKSADEIKAALEELAKVKQAQLSDREKMELSLKELTEKYEAEVKARAEAALKAEETEKRAAVLLLAQHFNDPEDAWVFVDKASITLEGGKVKGAKEAIDKIAKEKPHLLKAAAKLGGTPSPANRKPDNSKVPQTGARVRL